MTGRTASRAEAFGASGPGAPRSAAPPARPVVEAFERIYIDAVLRDTRGNVAEAARRSGKHRRAFFELMRRYGISGGSFRSALSKYKMPFQ